MPDHAAVSADHAVALIRLCNGCDNRFVRQHKLVDSVVLRAERLFSGQYPARAKFRNRGKCLCRMQLHELHRILRTCSGCILVIDHRIRKLQVIHQLERHVPVWITIADIREMAHETNACFFILYRCKKGIFRIRYDR